VQELIREYDRLSSNGVVVAVFQSPAERIAHYIERQAPPFKIIPDPELRLYSAYGVESSWRGFFRAWTFGLPRVSQAVLGNGFLPGSVEGNLNRIPADFVIGPEGRLADVYYGEDIGDHMPFSRVMHALDQGAAHQPK
jgi:peroxiredoxin